LQEPGSKNRGDRGRRVAHRLHLAISVGIARQLGDGIGHLVFRCRDVAAPLLLVALVAGTRAGDFLGAPTLDHWLDPVGCAVVALGLLVRCAAIASSRVRRAGIDGRVGANALCEDGAYAWCRNPLYAGNVLVLVGLALVFASRWFVFVGLPIAMLGIASLVAAEETVLTERFGARYAAYRARVARFVPRRPTLAAATPLNWRRALRREHGTIFAAVSAVMALLATKEVRRAGFHVASRHWPAWLLVWLAVAAAWATVRHLKRTARLGDVPVAEPEPTLDHVAA
jgi:protein-S-isoprenylcysteine O-methyltransferase Ste14